MNHIIEGPHFRFNEWVNTAAAKGADLVRNSPQMGKRDPCISLSKDHKGKNMNEIKERNPT